MITIADPSLQQIRQSVSSLWDGIVNESVATTIALQMLKRPEGSVVLHSAKRPVLVSWDRTGHLTIRRLPWKP